MKRLVLLLALAACSKESGDKPHSTTAAAHEDPAAAKKLIESGATVVDVRSPEEFDGGHLPQAKNVPIEQFAERLAEVGADKTKPVVVYCGKGGRASKAKAQLEAAGYTTVVNGGGYDDLR
jgi:phage shock protein E